MIHPFKRRTTALLVSSALAAMAAPVWAQAVDIETVACGSNGAVGNGGTRTCNANAGPMNPVQGNIADQGLSANTDNDASVEGVTLDLTAGTWSLATSNDQFYLAGGTSEDGDVTNSTLRVNNGAISLAGGALNLYGGAVQTPTNAAQALTGNASGNKLIVGGAGHDVDLAGESVNIAGGMVGRYGQTGNVTGNAEGNSVELADVGVAATSGQVGIYGGKVDSAGVATGNAKNNMVTLSGTTKLSLQGGNNEIVGGQAPNGEASGNTVNVGGILNVNTPGALSFVGGDSDDGAVVGNRVNISASGNLSGAEVIGGNTDAGNAQNNTVEISGDVDLSGSEVTGGYSDEGSADGNTVKISGAANLASAQIRGGISGGTTGTVKDNRVEIASTSGAMNLANAEITAAYVDDSSLQGGATQEMSGNAVSIGGTGGSIDLSGATVRAVHAAQGFAGTVGTGNSITLDASNGAIITTDSSTNLYAADIAGDTGTAYAGNTLSLKGASSTFVPGSNAVWQVGKVDGFQNLDFVLPANIGDGDTVLKAQSLTLSETAPTHVSVAFSGEADHSKEGITLIDAASNNFQEAADAGYGLPTTVDATQGGLFHYEMTLGADGKAQFSDRSGTLGKESKSLAEGSIASALSVAYASGDLVLEQVGAAASKAQALRGQTGGVGFGAVSGSDVKYKTGSHVNADGWNVLAGVAATPQVANGNLMVGAFFEYGDGNYDSHNSFASGKVKGDGDTKNYGIGVLGRYDFGNHVYVEGSVRGGRVKNDDFKATINGNRVKYDQDGNY
jgi:hypothetical protein